MARASNFSRQSTSDEDFTRAAWDLLKDVELNTYGSVQIELRADLRRGVWKLNTTVFVERVEGHPYALIRYQGDYPNSRAATLASYLFAHMNTVAQMAEGAYNEWLKSGGKRA